MWIFGSWPCYKLYYAPHITNFSSSFFPSFISYRVASDQWGAFLSGRCTPPSQPPPTDPAITHDVQPMRYSALMDYWRGRVVDTRPIHMVDLTPSGVVPEMRAAIHLVADKNWAVSFWARAADGVYWADYNGVPWRAVLGELLGDSVPRLITKKKQYQIKN